MINLYTNVNRTFQLINIKENIYSNDLFFQALNVQLSDKLRVTIALGDISQQTTGGIVNWTDGGLTHSVTQCSKVIAARAGALMRAACNDYIENKGNFKSFNKIDKLIS